MNGIDAGLVRRALPFFLKCGQHGSCQYTATPRFAVPCFGESINQSVSLLNVIDKRSDGTSNNNVNTDKCH